MNYLYFTRYCFAYYDFLYPLEIYQLTGSTSIHVKVINVYWLSRTFYSKLASIPAMIIAAKGPYSASDNCFCIQSWS